MLNPFNNISEKNKQKLLNILNSDMINFKENQVISKNILDRDSLGILVSGYLQIIRVNPNGNNIIVDEYEENDVFQLYYTYGKSNDYEIISKEKSQVIFIDIKEITNFNDNSKQYFNIFIKNLFLILNKKMTDKNKRIQILTKKTIRNKLLEYFDITSNAGSKYVYLPYSFMALADYLGVDRAALSREIRYLKDEGFIEVKGKRITLLYK